MKADFEKQLKRGKLAESKIASWLRFRQGWTVIPVYEIEIGQGKGPQIYTPDDQIVAPDLLIWKGHRFRFIEAKNKSVFTWYREKKRWQTGIDRRHWRDYLKAADHFAIDVWLMFLHEQATPSAIDLKFSCCPRECPIGLYGNPIRILKTRIDHTSDRHGPSGMVYWNLDSLQLICPIDELESHDFDAFAFNRSEISGTQQPLFLGTQNI